MRWELEKLYEKILIEEVAGALNYWISSDGDLIKVNDHINYAIRYFDLPYDIDNNGYPVNPDGSILEEDELYDYVYSLGYSRVVEEPATIYVSYHRTNPPNKKQFMTLYGMAEDKNKNLVDAETNKVIVRKNEIEPDVARSSQLDKMETEMKPSFYKNRRDYGESFAKYDLADYTQIIYEGKSGHGDEKAVRNLLDEYIKKGMITVKDTKGGWLVKSTDGKVQEAIHKGERAFYYLRRFLRKLG